MSDTSCNVKSNNYNNVIQLITCEILDFFFKVMDANFLRRLIVFLSSALVGDTCACYSNNGLSSEHSNCKQLPQQQQELPLILLVS